MGKLSSNNIIIMLLSAATFIGGYFFLRLAYHISDKMPFTQEIILIILGTLATILITAMLLNKQTVVELEKEQSIKFIELKTETYQKLIDIIESMVLHHSVTQDDLTKLQFQTHRLAIFASAAVLEEYERFLKVFDSLIVNDKNVSSSDEQKLAEALARLTVYIRSDLIGELDEESGVSQKEISRQIMANIK